MGCSASKFTSGVEYMPSRLKPLLVRGFDEMRRRRHGVSLNDSDSATLSKKKLLKSSIPRDFDHSSISSQEDRSLKVAPAPESGETAPSNKMDPNSKVAETASLEPVSPAKDVERDHKAVEAPSPEWCSKELKKSKKEKNIQQEDKKKEVEEMEATATAADENWEEENGKLSSLMQKCDCPGSPSFRFYCIEPVSNIKEEDGIDKNFDDDVLGKKSECEDCSANSESTNDSEGDSMTKTKKKGRKGIRLRRVITKGRPAAVMNFLNVKSCCRPACIRRDNAHRLVEKAVA